MKVRKHFTRSASSNDKMKRITAVTAFLALTQWACIGVGYSNRGGWFVWPGGLGLVLVIALIFFVLRRR